MRKLLLSALFFLPAAGFSQNNDTMMNAKTIDSVTIVNIIDKKLLEAEKKQKKKVRDTVNYSAIGRAISFKVLLQTRYQFSTTPNIDVNGAYYADDKKGINNSFSVKRARFFINPKINDHFDAQIMVDLAEFSGFTSSSLSGKVLDNAYIHYSPNKYINVRAGQFRPNLGIEDIVPVDLIRSLDYSNGYYSFGKSGWYSFQTGVEVYGDLPVLKPLKLKYYAGVVNGNGKAQPADNDRMKNTYLRLTTSAVKHVVIGAAAGIGSTQNENGYFASGDLNANFKLADKWSLELSSEYRDGNNFSVFSTAYTADPTAKLNQYRARDFYIFPEFRYEYNRSRLRGIDFAVRYEYYDPSYRIDKNPETTLTPLVGLMFADEYYSTLQLGVNINMYKHEVDKTAYKNNNLWVLQWQIRF